MAKYSISTIVRKIPKPERWWVEWFWATNFEYDETTGCLNWTKKVGTSGYGRTSMDGVVYQSHRMAYAIYYMEYDHDLLVRHICDNRRCCNPLHLTKGTHKENTADAIARGRFQTGANHHTKRHPELIMRGELRYNAVLTEADVREIRQCIADNIYKRQELAEIFGVHVNTINRIYRRERWAHVE